MIDYDDMIDYEYAILQAQESEVDDCRDCPYAGVKTCNNQCLEVVEIHNPYLQWEV